MKHFYIDPKTVLGGIVYSDARQEVVHLSLLKGNTVPEYSMDAEINLFLIEGNVEVALDADRKELNARELLILEPNRQHSMKALEDSQILVTKIR